ncbi:DNA-binding transcriptional LysR family regulator [Sporomusa sp. KB1]|nr:DNA-binding transcriptional LysR family regulator [Sporomusa sp. KB1]
MLYFFEVARQESFTKASETLYVSQSTISKLIKNLENELGAPLFRRTPKRIILTDEGRLLFPKAQAILNILNSIETEFSDLTGTPPGRLKVAISPLVQAINLFPKAIAEFKSMYPQVTIDLFEVGSRKVESGLSDGTIDVGVIMFPSESSQELEVVPFFKDPMMLIVHPGHSLAAKSPVSLNDLRDEPLVLYQEDFALHHQIIEKFHRFGLEPKVMCETAQWQFMVDIVSSKLAIAFLPRTVCEKLDPQLVKTLPLAEEFKPWHLAIAWRNNTYLSFSTKVWLAHIFKVFGIAKN